MKPCSICGIECDCTHRNHAKNLNARSHPTSNLDFNAGVDHAISKIAFLIEENASKFVSYQACLDVIQTVRDIARS